MPNWLNIRVKTEPAKMRHVRQQIIAFPEVAMERFYFQRLQSVTAAGVDVMRNYLTYDKAVWTPTGIRRKANGGFAGRNKTGAMVKAIRWTGGKIGPNKYKFDMGWLDGEPGYSIFQEHGTKTGIKAANSLAYTMEFMKNELKLMGTNPKAFRGTRASQFRSED